MSLDVDSCREADEGDEHGDEDDGVLCEVHEGGEVAHILHVCSVQNSKDSGVLF